MELTSYRERRAKLLEKMHGGVAIIESAPHQTRSHDTEFPYRQDSNFKYLVGFEEPEAKLVILSHQKERQAVLFVRPKDPKAEVWSGRRLGVESAKEILDVDEVYSIDEFDQKLDELLLGHDTVYLDLFNRPKLVKKVLSHISTLGYKNRKKIATPQKLGNIVPIVGSLRLIKDQNEIAFMRKAAAITTKAHKAAMAFTKPGVNEKEVQALMEYIYLKEGASGPAYESIVAGGDNANILHYIDNCDELKSGDLLLIDAGSEFNLYASDVTRTFPVNGIYTGIQKEVYEIVLEAQKASLRASAIGATIAKIHAESSKVLAQGLIDLKLMDSMPEELNTDVTFRTYYPHGTSHWLGLDVHDNCPYSDGPEDITFKPGMIYTIEPGLYFPKNGAGIPEELRGIGIRIEDDILITESGYENLTSAIPKEVKEVEEACKQNYKDFL